ncbi:MAG: hydroxymethylbilane synthase [Thermoguttaceae bacterium]|nr:hydroxymethylbilane synthase [Thermoguttaceae bacterium]
MASGVQIRLGTRASALAQWQADWVLARLQERGARVTLVPISTSGDRDQQLPVDRIGGQGVFTKEIQRALLDGRIDLAVHSLKDLPTAAVEGLSLAAVPHRASTGDVLVSRRYPRLSELPQGAVVGTGSLRRQSQLLHYRADLKVQEIRGNVDTRLRKLDEGQFDAIVLAEAGLQRLGLADRITELVPPSILLPAVGQGALGLETRADDRATRAAVEPLDHPETHAAVVAERAMLAALHGGCMAPIAAWARVEEGILHITGRVLRRDGSKKLEASHLGPADDAASIGRELADELIAQGAAGLIEASRSRD